MEFIPVAGKLVIQPLKEIKVSKRIIVPDEDKNKDKKPSEVMEVKKVTQKVPSNFQLAEIKALPEGFNMFKVGDVVVFRPNPAAYTSLDLIKGVYLIDLYLIVGLWVGNTSSLNGKG